MKLKSLFFLLGLGAVFVAGYIIHLLFFRSPSVQTLPLKRTSPISISYGDSYLIDKAFDTSETWSLDPQTRFAIVPHHLIAARPMASLFKVFPKTKTLFLISPDHFSQGKTVFTTTENDFQLTDRAGTNTIRTEAGKVHQLVQEVSELRIDAQPFLKEHGIYSLLPFLQKTNPNAQIIPIIIRFDAKSDQLDKLVQTIKRMMKDDRETALLASIDMSHYQIQEVADFHDELTQAVIMNNDTERIPKVEIDSHGSMYIILSLVKQLGYTSSTIHGHTNSLILTKAIRERSSTSHIAASFTKGESMNSSDPVKTEFWHQLPKIKTDEDRLYQGYDEEHVFQQADLPYFFGVVTKGEDVRVYPLPFDQRRQLLTRTARTEQIKKDLTKIQVWIDKTIRAERVKLIY